MQHSGDDMPQGSERWEYVPELVRCDGEPVVHKIYNDAFKYVDRIPRVEAEAVATTLDFMGKKGLPIETFADNSIIDRLVREGFVDRVYKKR